MGWNVIFVYLKGVCVLFTLNVLKLIFIWTNLDLKPILKKINFKLVLFHFNFSPSILYLFTTIFLTSHQLVLFPLTLLTIRYRHLPPFIAAVHYRLPPIAIGAALNCFRLPSSTATKCRWWPRRPPHLPPSTVHRLRPTTTLSTTVYHHPLSPLASSATVYHR